MARTLNVSLSRQTLVDLRLRLREQAHSGPPSATLKRQRQRRDLAAVEAALAGGPLARAAERELAERHR